MEPRTAADFAALHPTDDLWAKLRQVYADNPPPQWRPLNIARPHGMPYAAHAAALAAAQGRSVMLLKGSPGRRADAHAYDEGAPFDPYAAARAVAARHLP